MGSEKLSFSKQKGIKIILALANAIYVPRAKTAKAEANPKCDPWCSVENSSPEQGQEGAEITRISVHLCSNAKLVGLRGDTTSHLAANSVGCSFSM